MKVKLSTEKSSKRKYPYIGHDPVKGTVVIFTAPDAGFALRHEQEGVHWDGSQWDERKCQYFEGTITLSND